MYDLYLVIQRVIICVKITIWVLLLDSKKIKLVKKKKAREWVKKKKKNPLKDGIYKTKQKAEAAGLI